MILRCARMVHSDYSLHLHIAVLPFEVHVAIFFEGSYLGILLYK